MHTRNVIFAAVDMDCDGPSTALYKVAVPLHITVHPGDFMPRSVWDETFNGSNYFSHDDMFAITEGAANRALVERQSIHGGVARWFDHGKFEHASVGGIIRD